MKSMDLKKELDKCNDVKVVKEEILYQQLQLLAEESKICPTENLCNLTIAMCELCKLLP